jgi:UV DNA damage endonuclease
VNPSLPELGVHELVGLAGETWRKADGRQEVHFSTQAPGRRAGAHADTIDLRRFRRFVAQVDDLPLDCVLEVKDKEQSVLRARRTQTALRQKAARPA